MSGKYAEWLYVLYDFAIDDCHIFGTNSGRKGRMVAMLGEATIDISEARRQLNTLDERLSREPIIFVTRHNKRAFAIVDTEYIIAMMETLEIMSDPKSHQMFLESLDDIRESRLHDHDDVERELG